MQNLDVINFPLYGTQLIEASAGTGKTYSIIIIYLRLLLNLQYQVVPKKSLTVKDILVVTFTQEAAQELRTRIRSAIQQFRLDCIRGYSNNYLFSKLLLNIKNINLAIIQLSAAEKQMHQASIFTIHGFCQKLLTQHTIELNILFNTSIIENEKKLHQTICADFWRKNFYLLPINISSLIQNYWKNPEQLLRDISPYIYGEIPKFQYSKFLEDKNNKNIQIYYNKIISYITKIKKIWKDTQHNLVEIINTYDINRRIYNKKNLTSWINIINQWAQQPTNNHIVPYNLKRFKESTLNAHYIQNTHSYSLFALIEQLYQCLSSFKELIFDIAINNMRRNLKNTDKQLKTIITFNDLINLISYNCTNNTKNKLLLKISTYYPAIIIDEFQDTDLNQYKIFHTLHSMNHAKHNLILIGDPKQAIYGFRGADIFTYIKVRQSIYHKYNLNINWRSSSNMVNAINQLFQSTSNPFIFKDIPFIPSQSTHQNGMYRFLIHNKPQKPICFWLHPDNIVTINDYQKTMAKECAITLKNLLYNIHNKDAWIENHHKKRILKTSDIIILVRNHKEASLIQSELHKANISTIFLSNHKNIFETIEAYELLLLLQSILYPERKTICTALTTIYFKFDAITIENVYNNTFKWEQILKEFSEYHYIWKNYGILSMIKKIIFKYEVPKSLLSTKIGKNNLINILHLGELLNNISIKLNNEHTLIQWLTSQITQSQEHANKSSNHILRFNDDYELIKISTIHKSKGLEFPLTFLPFVTNLYYNKKNYFHDRKTYQPKINLDTSRWQAQLLEEERLSEDLRLLYVAITRSIYHCSMGIAPIIYNKKNLTNLNINSDLHHSALGYLIQNKQPSNAQSLKQYLKILNIQSHGDITFRLISQKTENFVPFPKPKPNYTLCAKKWIAPKYNNIWNITSYSILKHTDITKKSTNLTSKELLNIDLNNSFYKKNTTPNTMTPHTFPKGKIYGIFFHDLFKSLDFEKPINISWLQLHMEQYNIDLNWTTILQDWINIIINTDLNKENLTLSQITTKNKKTEFRFHLSIDSTINAQELDSLCKYYDILSFKSPPLNFSKTTGILKGFIDLFFYWNNKYYLLDYKTNWIGENCDCYTSSKIKESMIKYRYELQYQLYTLALHRFLKNRVKSYEYEKNFGGIFYLFIRGINNIHHSNGIYFCRLSYNFINKLDNLFQKTIY